MIFELETEKAPILTVDRWDVREMILTPGKVRHLWEAMQNHRSLFSDLTEGDMTQFVQLLTNPASIWYEFWEEDAIVGLVWIGNTDMPVEGEVHIVIFDRKPAEKLAVCQSLLRWVFQEYPFHRLMTSCPRFYRATRRLIERMGFQEEGCKREALSMGGKWNDVLLYGILRSEVEAQ